MLDDLFTFDPQSTAQTSEIELPEDVSMWPQMIQQVAMGTAPILSQFPGQLIIDAFDEDKLFAKGSYVVDMNGEQIVVPVIIRAKQLLPMDVFIHNGQWYPLDSEYLETLATSAAMGTDLVRPSEVPATANGDMRKGIVPPGHKPYTGSVSPMVVTASAKYPKVTADILETITKSAAVKKLLHLNKVAFSMFDKMISATASKLAGTNPLTEDSIVVSLGNGQFSIKTAKTATEFDTIECSGDELAEYIKSAGLNSTRMLDELVNNNVAFGWTEQSTQATQKLASVKKMGAYTGYSADTLNPVGFTVVAMVKRIDGEDAEEVLTVCDDDSSCTQKEVAGTPCDKPSAEIKLEELGNTPADSKISIPLPSKDEEGPLEALEPINVKALSEVGGHGMMSGETDGGDKTVIIVIPSGKLESPVKADVLPKELGIDKKAHVWYVPSDYPVIHLPKKAGKLISSQSELTYRQNLSTKTAGKTESAHVWKMSRGSNAVKIGSANPVMLSDTETILCLKKLGQNVLSDNLMAKLASTPIKFDVKIQPKKAPIPGVKIADKLSLIKTAAALEDEETIDQVLSLNYVNPDNMNEFIGQLPKLKETESELAKLLTSTRLGNEMIDEQSVKSALKEVHNVVKTLSRHA